MGIRERVEDAELLWKEGRTEGALMAALVAVASTARRKYPDASDREGFEEVMRDARTWRLNLEFRGKSLPVERLLYKWFRCELIHSGGLPVDIRLVPPLDPEEVSARAGGAPNYELELSETWLHHLLDVVIYEPVNADLFPPDWRDGPVPA